MPADVVMPKMGYDMTEGKISRWLKSEGDRVSRGEPIAEIETEKVTIEIESFVEGRIKKLLAQAGQLQPRHLARADQLRAQAIQPVGADALLRPARGREQRGDRLGGAR